MDKRDRAILGRLQTDATLTLEALAAAVNLSPASVSRRVQALEGAGLIRGRVALLDADRLGLGLTALTQVSLKAQDAETRRAFERFVTMRPEVLECYAVSGVHDYRLMVIMRDIAAYERFLMEDLLAHRSVRGAETVFVLRRVKYSTALDLDAAPGPLAG